MTAAAVTERFEAFLDELRARAQADPDIVGLVGLGSTAERDRVDEWSDHDFALVTAPGRQERFRSSLDWLPAAGSIALELREHHGGVKVIYDDGHVLEFGITDLAGLAGWAANAFDVLYDAGGVAEAMADIVAKPLPTGAPDDVRDVSLVLTQLFIGVGRARRGELLVPETASARRPSGTCCRCWADGSRRPGPCASTAWTRGAASRRPTRPWARGSTTCSRVGRRTAPGRCST